MPGLHDLVADPAPFLRDADPAIRRLAVSACSGSLTAELAAAVTALLESDPEPRVRAEAAEVLAEIGPAALPALVAATSDPAGEVREAVATGLGELADPAAIDWLSEAAASDPDKPVREAAVAALGAIGATSVVPLLIELLQTSSPQVRRRCVVALSVFDGAEVEAALRAARSDRNPMVREAAVMVVGTSRDG